ncbi:hypothetical protein I6E61_07205 [Psychrobacter sp. NZS113]|uniref:hypothetical protein n=1 Tax=Psychrobacter sp. NZS113 TaxID=2792045 RepID=UPI0018CE80BD|nr:hypothetical protein [Psychrobacter sp. NZS113]MBH0096166.1 hypothetical protein [Psychrobacter sp. NZS113]
MKKNLYRLVLTILFIAMAGCSNTGDINSPAISKTHEGEVSLSQTQTLETPQSRLNCAQFNLDIEDNMVCTYWKDSKKFKEAIKIQDYETYSSLIEANELSPIEYGFFATTKSHYKNKSYEAKVFPNSRVQLSNGNEIINLICNIDSCSKPFLWGFATESTVRANPKLADAMMIKLSSIYSENYGDYLDKINKQSLKGKLAAKVFFENSNLEGPSYVIRYVDKASPLKNSIQEYLNGLTLEEKKLGFETSNFDNDSFQVHIEKKTALINFKSSDLSITGPEQILNFTYNISKIAEQFDTVNKTEICINDTYNYQMAFLANEEPIECPFSF